MGRPKRPDATNLRFGPYASPSVHVGEWIYDEERGLVEVGGLRDTAPLPWPYRVGQGRAFILCGDLVRALKQEARAAVQYWWGAGHSTVDRWRAVLGLEELTPGTRELQGENLAWRMATTPGLRAKAIAASHTREAIERQETARRERPDTDRWAPEDLLLIGAASDNEVARQIGRTRVEVEVQRRRLGRPAVAENRPWTAAERARLGTIGDHELAQELGRTLDAVRTQRSLLRIPSCDDRRWTEAEVALLGKLSDREVAKRIGRSLGAVDQRRRARGIPPVTDKRPWAKAELRLLGRSPDDELAERFGRPREAVASKRRSLGIANPEDLTWTEPEVAQLGALPDREVAARTGRSEHAIAMRRRALNRPAVARPHDRVGPRWWTEAESALVGTMPDVELAEHIGKTRLAVARRRAALGRPAFGCSVRKSGRPKNAKPHVRPVPSE